MKIFYVTLGQSHIHSVGGKTFDKDCVATIDADNYEDARNKVFEIFGKKFCFVYEEKPNMSFYPRGLMKL